MVPTVSIEACRLKLSAFLHYLMPGASDWLHRWQATGLDVLAKSLLLFLLALAFLTVFHRISAATRHLVWRMVLVCLLIMPILSGLLPNWQISLPLPTPGTAPASGPKPQDTARTQEPLLSIERKQVPHKPPKSSSVITPPKRVWPTAQSAPSSIRETTSIAPTTPASQPFSWGDFVFIMWVGGGLCVGLRAIMGALGLRKLYRASQEITSGSLQDAADRMAVLSGLHNSFTLRCPLDTTLYITPMTWGWHRPTILLPTDAADWPVSRLESVLLHEIAHILRKDWLWLRLGQIVCAIYWFHPLVWLAAWRLRQEAERACDDCVLSSGVKPSDYAQHLLDVVRLLAQSQQRQGLFSLRFLGVAMAQTVWVEGRLRAILESNCSRRPTSHRAAAVTFLLLLSALLPYSTLRVTAMPSTVKSPGILSGQDTLAHPLAAPFRMDPVPLSHQQVSAGVSVISEPAVSGSRLAVPSMQLTSLSPSRVNSIPVLDAKTQPIAWGPVINGLQAGLRLKEARERYQIGEPIWQEVYVRNFSQQSVKFISSMGFEEQGWPTVTNAKGVKLKVYQYFGRGGMALSEKMVKPEETVLMSRTNIGFRGTLKPPSVVQNDTNISFEAQGMPIVADLPGTYKIQQSLTPSTPDNKSILPPDTSLITGAIKVTITSEHINQPAPQFRTNIRDLADAPVAWGKPHEGVQVGLIYLDGRDYYTIGERARFGVILRNTGVRTAHIGYQIAYPKYPPPMVVDTYGKAVHVSVEPEPDARSMGRLQLTGVTYDMSHSPSVNGSPRIGRTELKPGQAVIGYYDAGIVIPPSWDRKAGGVRPSPGKYKVRQAFPISLDNSDDLKIHLETGLLPLTIFDPDAKQEANGEDDKLRIEERKPSIAWGKSVSGLQVGVRFTEERPFYAGEQIWLEFFVRNADRQPITFTYHTGSVYIDPPPVIVDKRGKSAHVAAGEGQIIHDFTKTLQPGELFLIGHPNMTTSPTREVRFHSGPYPALLTEPGAYLLTQSFPLDLPGGRIVLTSGTLNLTMARPAVPIAWGESEGGIQHGVQLQGAKTRFRYGDEITVYSLLRNTTKQNITVTYLTNGESVTPTVTDKNGDWKQIQEAMLMLLPHENSHTIKPGEQYLLGEFRFEIRNEPRKLGYGSPFLVVTPGRYTIQQRRVSNYVQKQPRFRDWELASGKITIDVDP